jgi:hypothetical protein
VKYKRWIRERISEGFYKKCLEAEFFQKEPETIIPAFKFLNDLSYRMDKNDRRPVTFYSVDIKDRFSPYTDSSYTHALKALTQLQLLEINHSYIGSYNKTGVCKKYNVLPTGVRLLCESNLQWFKKLNTDKAVIRQQQKDKPKKYDYANDPMLKSLDHSLHCLDYDYNKLIAELLPPSNASFFSLQDQEYTNTTITNTTTFHYLGDNFDNAQITHINAVLNLLIIIKTRKYGELKRNESDGRVWNPFTALPARYKKYFTYDQRRYVSTIDMRACHLSFLGLLLSELNTARPEGLNLELPAVLDHSDDLSKWMKWVSAQNDPRQSISRFTGWDMAKTKESANMWLNGHKKYKIIDKWLKMEFPTFYRIWNALGENKKICGITISDEYETKIFLDLDIYELSSSLNLKLSYEYDGLGVFGYPDEFGLEVQIQRLNSFVKSKIANCLMIEHSDYLTKVKL